MLRTTFRRTALAAVITVAEVTAMTSNVFAEGNPYRGGWSNCTWGAWQLTYDKLGIALPGMGNAYEWLGNAAAYGYATGSAPAANSIIVWSNGRTGLGHVAYVDYVNEDGTIFIEEGGNGGHYAARTVDPYNPSSSLVFSGYIYLGDATEYITYDTYESDSYTVSESQAEAINMVVEAAREEHQENGVVKLGTSAESSDSVKSPAVVSHYIAYADQTVDFTDSGTLDIAADDNSVIILADSSRPAVPKLNS